MRRLVPVRLEGDPTEAKILVSKEEIKISEGVRYFVVRPSRTSLVDDALSKGRKPDREGNYRIPIK